MVSPAFVHWEGRDSKEGKKGRFVQAFHVQSRQWEKRGTRMETKESFASLLREGDRLLSFDVKAGYRHFFLHPDMRNYFLFRYDGRFFRCKALPFGWGRSAFWFVNLLKPFVIYIREHIGARVLPYIDDFLMAPSIGRASTAQDCRRVSKAVDSLMEQLGLERHNEKGVWDGGATRVAHLGVMWDTERMTFTATEPKVEKVRRMAKELIREAVAGRRWVTRSKLASFCGVAVSMMLPIPLARFYTRSLHDALSDWTRRTELAARCGLRTRLSNRAVKDLQVWRRMGPGGRLMQEDAQTCDLSIHTDAAELGWGGTVSTDLRPGGEGEKETRGVWDAKDRRESITWRELKAFRLLLESECGARVAGEHVQRIRFFCDNQAVVYIVRAMVSASKVLMKELRILERLLRALKVTVDIKWLPSGENVHADRLSRQWDPTDLQVTRRVLNSLRDSYQLGERGAVFRCRPLGLPPVAQRKIAVAALKEHWGPQEARLYNPPPDMVSMTLAKMRREGARGIVLVPAWNSAPWMAELLSMADKVETYDDPIRSMLAGRRKMNHKWRLLVAQVNVAGCALSGGGSSHRTRQCTAKVCGKSLAVGLRNSGCAGR